MIMQLLLMLDVVSARFSGSTPKKRLSILVDVKLLFSVFELTLLLFFLT